MVHVKPMCNRKIDEITTKRGKFFLSFVVKDMMKL